MEFYINGLNVPNECETTPKSNVRGDSPFSTSPGFLYGGMPYSSRYASFKLASYPDGYVYSKDGLGGKYFKNGSPIRAAARGCRPQPNLLRWASPKTDTLFMARPTMSKVLYTQQLGRGMRLSDGKKFLMVFDFVDNANMFNTSYSLHRMFGEKKYHEGGMVLGSKTDRAVDEELYRKGERPDALIDYPISTMDYELVDIFNWQTEAEGMLSQMEFVRMVDVQSETVERYLREEKIKADLVVQTGSTRVFRYFKQETIEKYAIEFGWQIITDDKKKDLFLEMVNQMDMSYSYKPVLLKAIFESIDSKGRIALTDIVKYFIAFYADRKVRGLVVEKSNSLYCKDSFSDKDVERNILSNPYKRFEEMNMLHHTKTLGIIELDKSIFKKLNKEDIENIKNVCDVKIAEYYKRF